MPVLDDLKTQHCTLVSSHPFFLCLSNSFFTFHLLGVINASTIEYHQIANIGLEPKKPQLGSVEGP